MKGAKYFIDTNIFLRVLMADEERQFVDSTKLLAKIREGKLKAMTSTLVLTEIQWTLKNFYKLPKEEVVFALETITNLKNLHIEDNTNPKIALHLYKKYNVKFVDCLLASRLDILDRQLTVISYDKEFDDIGIKRIEPKKLL